MRVRAGAERDGSAVGRRRTSSTPSHQHAAANGPPTSSAASPVAMPNAAAARSMTAVVMGGSSSASSTSFLRPSLIRLRRVALGAAGVADTAEGSLVVPAGAADADGEGAVAVGAARADEGGKSGWRAGAEPGAGAGFRRSDAVASDSGLEEGPPDRASSGPLTAAATDLNGLPLAAWGGVVLTPASEPLVRIDDVRPGRAPATMDPAALAAGAPPPAAVASAASAAAAAALSSTVLACSWRTRRSPMRTPTPTAVWATSGRRATGGQSKGRNSRRAPRLDGMWKARGLTPAQARIT